METNQHEMDRSVLAFLEALGLPDHHPFLSLDAFQGKVGGSTETPSPKQWSILDYFITRKSGEDLTPNSLPNRFPTRPSFIDKFEIPLETSNIQCDGQKGGGGVNNFSQGYVERTRSIPSPVEGTPSQIKIVLEDPENFSMSFLKVSPCLWSSFHLFLRLLAPLIVWSCMLYIMTGWVFPASTDTTFENKITRKGTTYSNTGMLLASWLGLACAMVMLTDSMYVLEFGRLVLGVQFALMVMIVLIQVSSSKTTRSIIVLSVILTFILIEYCDLEHPTIEPGFYYNDMNPVANAIAREWPVEMRTYDDGRGTPWLCTGDSRTGMPFLLNSIPDLTYVRRWLPVDKNEALIMDIAFPKDGKFHSDKPVYLVLHGLNGGSKEDYVKDFVMRQMAAGSTVAVMVTRGLMDSPILGNDLPHFTRTSDVHTAATTLRKAIGPHVTLGGVGYSMGAITLANYVAYQGNDCPLDAAVSLSGALDTRQQYFYRRSRNFWQSFLSKTLKDTMLEKFSQQLYSRLSREEIESISIADSMISLDEAFFVKYNNYPSIMDYYSDMGAMGDFESWDHNKGGRIANVSVPLLVVNALDDPIAYWKTLGDPVRVSHSGQGYTMLLITRYGGHVGWPLGLDPRENAWRWMSEVASSFVTANDKIIKMEKSHIREQSN